MKKSYWASFNYLEFKLPRQAVIDCHHQGACDDDVAFWQKKLKLNLDRKKMISELKEYGAWSEQELNDLDDSELEEKLIWIAAGNIQDENEVI